MEMSMYQDMEADKAHMAKTSMSLDFKNGKPHRFQNMLNSPDLNMLKLSSPELEKMLITQNGSVGTTPTPTQFIYPKYVTDEQEAYARGFVEALAELHSNPTTSSAANTTIPSSTQSGPSTYAKAPASYSNLLPMSSQTPYMTNGMSPIPSTSMMSGGVSRRHPPFAPSGLLQGNPPHNPMANLPPQPVSHGVSHHVKMEPSSSAYPDHQVPHSPDDSSRVTDSPSAMSDYDHVENVNRLDSIPVDLEEQEKIKLERKRARNRIAARKCRTRKLERINRLEDKVSDLKGRNSELAQTAASLNEQVMQLKQQIMEHMRSGCHIMLPPEMRPM